MRPTLHKENAGGKETMHYKNLEAPITHTCTVHVNIPVTVGHFCKIMEADGLLLYVVHLIYALLPSHKLGDGCADTH